MQTILLTETFKSQGTVNSVAATERDSRKGEDFSTAFQQPVHTENPDLGFEEANFETPILSETGLAAEAILPEPDSLALDVPTKPVFAKEQGSAILFQKQAEGITVPNSSNVQGSAMAQSATPMAKGQGVSASTINLPSKVYSRVADAHLSTPRGFVDAEPAIPTSPKYLGENSNAHVLPLPAQPDEAWSKADVKQTSMAANAVAKNQHTIKVAANASADDSKAISAPAQPIQIANLTEKQPTEIGHDGTTQPASAQTLIQRLSTEFQGAAQNKGFGSKAPETAPNQAASVMLSDTEFTKAASDPAPRGKGSRERGNSLLQSSPVVVPDLSGVPIDDRLNASATPLPVATPSPFLDESIGREVQIPKKIDTPADRHIANDLWVRQQEIPIRLAKMPPVEATKQLGTGLERSLPSSQAVEMLAPIGRRFPDLLLEALPANNGTEQSRSTILPAQTTIAQTAGFATISAPNATPGIPLKPVDLISEIAKRSEDVIATTKQETMAPVGTMPVTFAHIQTPMTVAQYLVQQQTVTAQSAIRDDLLVDVDAERALAISTVPVSQENLIAKTQTDLQMSRYVAQQVVDAVRHQPNGPIEIALNPEELGRVRISLNSQDGTMMVTLTVERAETAELLRRNMDSLSQEFRNIGYAEVSFTFTGDGSGTNQNEAEQSQSSALELNQLENAQELPPTPQLMLSSGIDIRI